MSDRKIKRHRFEEEEERRSHSQYILEFMKIPAYLFDESPSYDPDRKFRLTSIKDLMALDHDLMIDWESVSVTYYTTLKVKSVFFEFPLPICEPQAYYGMAIKRKGEPLVYYTLEMGSEEIPYFFCKVSEIGGHRMHSLIAPYKGELSAQAFIKHVLEYSEKHQSDDESAIEGNRP